MSDIHAIYNKLFEGSSLEISFEDRRAFDSLRTALVRHNSLMVGLDVSALSICADWDAIKKHGTFFLGRPRRRRNVTWTIVKETNAGTATIRETVAGNSLGEQAGDSGLPSHFGTDIDPSSTEGEMSLQHATVRAGPSPLWEVETLNDRGSDRSSSREDCF